MNEIVRSRGHERNVKYELNWAHPYSYKGHNTEEPLHHLGGSQDLLAEFRHNKRKTQNREFFRKMTNKKKEKGEILSMEERMKKMEVQDNESKSWKLDR